MQNAEKKQKTVMVFGTFDGIHPGHRHFFEQAKKFGTDLIIVVAQDTHTTEIKKHPCSLPLKTRLAVLKKEKIADRVVPGDEILGSWGVIHTYRPDVVAVGYDQRELESALKKAKKTFSYSFEIKKMRSHKPKTFHSSILRKAKTKKN